ncbi:MAG TPA: maleylpyruvate isomerase family mycothiol-dependent enzyme [Acidimicrobiales bacterium]|nr:maleylpyruvate isomerase family mycothiol-dependent enzyme [Acidimicrobiales bacterium]
MASKDTWPTIHAERKALATELEGLSDEQWAAPTECTEWTVRDVVAHMTATAKISGGAFFPKLIASGFSLTNMQRKDIARERGSSPADALARFSAEVDSSKHPPGPNPTWLGEVIIHSEDIRRALGLSHTYPPAAVIEVLDFYKGSNLVIGAKKRVAGVQLRATDAAWSTGSGPEASGPSISLLMAMTGRKSALAELSGPGVETLRARA